MVTFYVLKCADNSYHSGVAVDLERRLNYHTSGQNPESYTYKRLPVELVFQAKYADVRDAINAELEFYQLSLQEKELFINTKNSVAVVEKTVPAAEVTKPQRTIYLPAHYLGNIAYFDLIRKYDHVYLVGEERFQKQTYRSRATILTANGIQNLVVPVIRPNGKESKMAEIALSYAEDWQKNHCKAIESAYRNAPFYDFFAPDLLAIIRKDHNSLLEMNLELTRELAKMLEISTTFSINRNKDPQIDSEFWDLSIPKKRTDFNTPVYQQTFAHQDFAPNLSVIDGLFNLGKALFKA